MFGYIIERIFGKGKEYTRKTNPVIPADKDDLKKLLMSNPVQLHLNELNQNHNSRLTITHNNINFECFFIQSTPSKKLYILLNSSGEGIKFARVSYADTLDGNILCIDDPSRKLNDVTLGYYFGTHEHDITQSIVDIVSKFRDIYNIKNKNIIFIGSSNAGFAACKFCTKIYNSKSLLLSPIIDVQYRIKTTNPDGLQAYKRSHYLDKDEDIKRRLNIGDEFVKNKKSKYFFIFNDISKNDRKQLNFLCSKIGIEYKLGLNKKDNKYIYVVRIKCRHTHLVCIRKCILRVFEDVLYSKIRHNERSIFVLIDRYIREYIKNLDACESVKDKKIISDVLDDK